MAEFRIFGPPGTGKTTYLTSRIRGAVEKYGKDSVMVASFTRAAAHELTGRDLPIDRNRCGTLHAHCFRALGNPKVAESKIDEFNEKYPQFFLTGGAVDTDEGEFDQSGGGDGDKIMAEMQVYRAKLIPKDVWPIRVRRLSDAWEEFKFKNGYVDFTDMIERCAINPERVIPEGTQVGIFDETQDFTPMQLALVRGIGQHLRYFMLAGDDDQTIYGFTGATPKAFLEPDIEEKHKKILDQSYRVPKAVQSVAEAWVKRITDRQIKEYKPRDFEGSVRKLMGANNRSPSEVVERAIEDHENGKSSMILATCGYMLIPTLMELRERGIPFHNPYKTKRGDWNPLGARRGISSKERLAMYLEPLGPQAGTARLWTLEQLAAWTEIVEVKELLNRGAKKNIKDLFEKRVDLTDAELFKLYTKWFTPQGLNKAVELKTEFIEEHCVASKLKGLAYPIKVLNSCGIEALRETPKICIGTIHSVKGGQADNVYIYPDLSVNAAAEYASQEGHDSITRQFYVGMTRCRENLIIADSGGGAAVDISIG